jgi:lysyl-tRNA synthetase class 1
MSRLRELAAHSNSWPFVEARNVLKRFAAAPPARGYALFETGYGPSGLPHIGTFGEVARTSMIRHAFSLLSDIPTRLFAFSDDMDGLRKVPDNVPNREMMARYIGDKAGAFGTPLTSIPDPFGCCESFGHHNNGRLRAFLDAFRFEYEFKSSTECYRAGLFDPMLRRALEKHREILDVVLPELRDERRRTYCPFLPVRERGGRLQVLEIPAVEYRPAAGTIVFQDDVEGAFEVPVTGGHCKLQWRVDWAMRWAALGVDYEMSGKDLIDSVRLGNRICRILSGDPPVGFTYELFLDENGEKISKSKGNGLAVEDWLRYAPLESLALFMYQKPTAAKRLYFDVIPKTVDDYLSHLVQYPKQEPARQLDNPVWHIHAGRPPPEDAHLSFNILLNLTGVCHTEDKSVLWKYITRLRPDATPASAPFLDKLVEYAIVYYRDFVLPAKKYRPPSAMERAALADLARALDAQPADADAEAIQTEVYEVGKRHPFADLRAWFKALYEILLGQADGPRMGSFVALYGRAETRALIERALKGESFAGS